MNLKCNLCGAIFSDPKAMSRMSMHMTKMHPDRKIRGVSENCKPTTRASNRPPGKTAKAKKTKAKPKRKYTRRKKKRSDVGHSSKVVNVRVPLVINIPMVMGELRLDKAEIE